MEKILYKIVKKVKCKGLQYIKSSKWHYSMSFYRELLYGKGDRRISVGASLAVFKRKLLWYNKQKNET